MDNQCIVCQQEDTSLIFHAKSWEQFARDHEYAIRSCPQCGLVFTSPSVDDQALKEFYSQGLYRDTRNRLLFLVSGISSLFQYLRLHKINRDAQRRGRLLDVGCGKGRFIDYASRHGWVVDGVEPSETGRRNAAARIGREVYREISEIPPGSQFDVITLWHVLEHVDSPVEFVQQLRRYQNPGGLLFVAVPNLSSFQARLGKALWSHLDVPRHRVHYSPRTLSYVLCLAGYQVKSVDHFSLEFNPLGVLQTILNRLGCQPGLIYRFIKRDFIGRGEVGRLKYIYNMMMLLVGVPVLWLPATILAYAESIVGHGGTILACATPNSE